MKAKAPETPLISDDLMAQFNAKPAAPAFDANKTQQLPDEALATQRLDLNDPNKTQRMPAADVQKTQRLETQPAPSSQPPGDGDKTMKIQKLDPAYRPEETQRIDPNPPTQPLESSEAERTQRIDDSIWRLQEAKRILQGITPK